MTSTRDATHREPRSASPVNAPDAAPEQPFDISAYNTLFVSMVLSMSWQLAIVVIVPIVGGYLLDQRLGSSPWLTLTGLMVAVAATCVILWRTVQSANTKVASLQDKGGKK